MLRGLLEGNGAAACWLKVLVHTAVGVVAARYSPPVGCLHPPVVVCGVVDDDRCAVILKYRYLLGRGCGMVMLRWVFGACSMCCHERLYLLLHSSHFIEHMLVRIHGSSKVARLQS